MIKSNRKLAYYGPCSKLCRDNGDVCGINGVTYRSECEAWSGIFFSYATKRIFKSTKI